MKRLFSACAVLAVVSVVTAGAVRAQDAGAPATMYHFGVAGGGAIPMSNDIKDAVKTGWQVQPFVGATRGNWGVFLVGGYSSMKADKDSLATFFPGTTDAKLNVISGNLDLGYMFPTSGSLKPYVFAGPGVYNLKLKATPDSLSGDSRTKLGGQAGLGVMYMTTSGMGIGLEGTVNYVTDKPTGATASTKYIWIPVSLNVMFK